MFENIRAVATQPNQTPNYGLGDNLANVYEVTPSLDQLNQEQQFKVVNHTVIPSEQTAATKEEPKDNLKDNGFLRLPETQAEAMALAKLLSRSVLLPDNLRSTDSVDHTSDVFIIISLGCSLGMSAAQALRQIFVIKNRLGLYVSAKAGICYKHGSWTVSLENINGIPTAIAQGYRFDRPNESRKAEFSAFDARLKGKMYQNNGNWIGLATWVDKWPEMLKTRALGRLLDMLFPDVIGGFVDESYEPDAITLDAAPKEPDVVKTTALLKKVKGKKQEKTETVELKDVPTPAPTTTVLKETDELF